MKFAQIICLTLLSLSTFAQVNLTKLQVEYQDRPLGMDESKPRFSWQMLSYSASRGDRQSAYRIQVKDEKQSLVWDSQKIKSDISIGISYAGKALTARQKYTWQVQVWDQKNRLVSANSSFETGLLNSGWNNAQWIGSNDLPLYSNYLSVYKFQYQVQLDEATHSKKASFVFGANDPRLQNKNLNIQGVANAKNEAYIRFELDITDSTQAFFNVFRAGYDPKLKRITLYIDSQFQQICFQKPINIKHIPSLRLVILACMMCTSIRSTKTIKSTRHPKTQVLSPLQDSI